jgi:hypothetical protein
MISIHARECWQGLGSSDQNVNCLSDRSLHCILYDDLKWHLQKIQIVQQLHDTNKITQVAFCLQYINTWNTHLDILYKLIISDQAPCLCNKWKFLYWGNERLKQVYEKPLQCGSYSWVWHACLWNYQIVLAQ